MTSEEAQLNGLLDLRPPCARSSLITHREGEQPQEDVCREGEPPREDA